MSQTLDISWQTIIKIFIAGFIFYILFLARDIIVWFFFGLIISLLTEPTVGFLKKYLRLPKLAAVILVYSSILALIGLIIYLASPIFIFEINQLSKNIPDYFEKISPLLKTLGVNAAQNFQELTQSLIFELESSSKGIFRAITVFFGGVASTILIFTFAFYISLEEKGPERFLILLTPQKYEKLVLTLFEKVQLKVAGWFGIRILACFFVGIASFFIFFLFGTEYAFTLSLISGVLNLVPFIGPLITSILVILFVGVSNSWLVAIYIIAALFVVQQIENNFITPMLSKKLLDMPPILVLVSLLVGGTIFGLLGIIFVVPVFGLVYEFFKEFLEKRKEKTSIKILEQ